MAQGPVAGGRVPGPPGQRSVYGAPGPSGASSQLHPTPRQPIGGHRGTQDPIRAHRFERAEPAPQGDEPARRKGIDLPDALAHMARARHRRGAGNLTLQRTSSCCIGRARPKGISEVVCAGLPPGGGPAGGLRAKRRRVFPIPGDRIVLPGITAERRRSRMRMRGRAEDCKRILPGSRRPASRLNGPRLSPPGQTSPGRALQVLLLRRWRLSRTPSGRSA